MKRIFLVLCVLGLLVSNVSPTLGEVLDSRGLDAARMTAIFVRADWDEASRKLQPVFEGLMNRFDEEPVLFVTLDLTNATVRHQALLLSKELRLGKVSEEVQGKLGTIQFVTSQEERTVISALTAETSFEQASKGLLDALQHEPKGAAPPF